MKAKIEGIQKSPVILKAQEQSFIQWHGIVLQLLASFLLTFYSNPAKQKNIGHQKGYVQEKKKRKERNCVFPVISA